jgi:hypothetical protein
MDIRGEWFNELNSKMEITKVDGPFFEGKYNSAVGPVEGNYKLVGFVSVPSDQNRTIAFVVAWQNGEKDVDSVTAWSGEVREVGDEQYITTTWLVTGETIPDDDWQSTTIGKDFFSRNRRSDKEVALAKALRVTGRKGKKL